MYSPHPSESEKTGATYIAPGLGKEMEVKKAWSSEGIMGATGPGTLTVVRVTG